MKRREAKRPEGFHPQAESEADDEYPEYSIYENMSLMSPRDRNYLFRVGELLTALYDFEARADDEVSFKRGDTMKLLDGSEENHLKVRHLRSGCVGFIPKNHVHSSEDRESIESEECFFKVSCEEAERLLLVRANPCGTFLVRPGSSLRYSPFSLSLKDVGNNLAEHQVRHFKIRKISYGAGYYIILGEPFQSIHDLILYYKGSSLCEGYKLTQICPTPKTKVVARKPMDKEENLVEKHPSQYYFGGPSVSRKGEIVVALFDYQAKTPEDVSFVKGDKLEIIENSEDYWMTVSHLGSRHQGLIPSNYVAFDDTIESEDWFFKIGRKEAETLLLVHKNIRGTFLVRFRGANVDNSAFSLSVKSGNNKVNHYKIMNFNDRYFISEHQRFTTVQDLVLYYMYHEITSGCFLNMPCSKPKPLMWDLSPELRDTWELDRSDIKISKKLAVGKFGELYFGTWKDSIKVAVKTLKPGTVSPQAFFEEAAIMKKVRHDHLVALYGVCTKEEPIYIVLEFMERGSLLDFLRHSEESNQLTLENLIYITEQIASGMQYLESKNVIHRDLAARNVLVEDNNVVKICDFGLARILENDEYCPKQGSRFPVKWTAPEAIFFGQFTIKSDVWSFGILMMEIFTMGQVPYPGMSGREVMDQIERGYRMPKPLDHPVPDDVYKTMTDCWKKAPERRPTFDYLQQYFEDYNVSSELPYIRMD